MRSVPGAVRRAEHDDVAECLRDQLHPAEDERAHQDLAELGIGLDERHHLECGRARGLRRGARPDERDAAASREDADLSREHAGPDDRDEPFPLHQARRRTISASPSVTTKP